MFYYKAFNLVIKSSYEIKDLVEVAANSDFNLIIEEGIVPEHLENAKELFGIKGWSRQEYNGKEFLLEYRTIGKFLIEGDHKITLQKYPESSEEFFTVMLLNICFIYLFQMNNLFPIHSSAIEIDGACIAFIGNSGAGKSTTATQFLKQGHRIVTDDLSLIDFDEEGNPFVYPSYPQLRLWDETLSTFELNKEELIKINYKQEKFKKMLDTAHYVDEPLPLKKMYFLTFSPDNQLRFSELKGFEKVKIISSQVFGDSIIKTFNKSIEYFQFCQKLAGKIELCQIERPKNLLTVAEIYESIKADLKNSK